MQSNYWIYIETCFRDAINHLPKLFLEILLNPNTIKYFNINAIENLKVDLNHLEDYFKTISNTHLGFEESITPIKNLVNFFLNKKFEFYLNKKRHVDPFYDIKNEDLIKFASKYKNLKKSSDMKGKITENDISAFIKKLKEIK